MYRSLAKIAKAIKDELESESVLCVGKCFKHPDHGIIYITDGQFMGTYGVSNFWSWKKVKADGTLSSKTYHDYGGDWKPVKAKITKTIHVEISKNTK